MKKFLLAIFAVMGLMACTNSSQQTVPVYACLGWDNDNTTEESLRKDFAEYKEHGVCGICLNAGFDTAKIRIAARVAKAVGLE